MSIGCRPSPGDDYLLQVLYEKASQAGVLVAKRAPLALFANGKTSGIYVGMGGEFVSASVVSSGYTVPCTVRHCHKGGRVMDEYIAAQILGEGAQRPSEDQRMAGRLFDLGRSMGLSTLPDRSASKGELTGKELAVCSMAEMSKIQSCVAREERGQASQTAGLVERLQRDCAMSLRDGKVRVMGGSGFPTAASGGERGYCPWLGGSIVGSMGSFASLVITPKEYAEHGARIVHRKCF
ncbi:actin, putative [Perkinsus marinus ATCC 50983]|uniref:Actin, putative n=1 Tax=Perkinsus marinus (strain ATCC 50983 / TXsc) TaxID=423536 RepID=C5KGD4_PERM5|nr:actin, putative [Perkinsus marinus ATCC 50983]EER16490.1 actin, putative [Perkinsus marinus ATCC 50983]|eukprot:XP_002784694.1 actin, putative [Perkinsus marinus ATCC 50983]